MEIGLQDDSRTEDRIFKPQEGGPSQSSTHERYVYISDRRSHS